MAEYKGKTNKVNEFKLESGIDRVVWSDGSASVGAKVGILVETHFVGSGSDIKIQIKDSNGKTHGSISDKINGNKFRNDFIIPDKAAGSLIAEVKLPKHGVEMKSNLLTVYPAIRIKNLKWDKKEAKRGDIIKITADVENSIDGTDAEIEIWEYDNDLAHDFIVKIPVEVKNGKIETSWEFEYQEDTDDIPSNDELEQGYNPPEYFFRVKILGVSEDSEILGFKDWIEMQLKDDEGNPMADQDYELQFPDGLKKKGKTDSEGKILLEDIPPGNFKVIYSGTADQNEGPAFISSFTEKAGADESTETEENEDDLIEEDSE